MQWHSVTDLRIAHGLGPRAFGAPLNSFLSWLMANLKFGKLRRGITSQFTLIRKCNCRLWSYCSTVTMHDDVACMGVRRNFSRGGAKVDILLIFLRLLAMQSKWTYTKKNRLNVTATVAYSVFHIRKRYSEQMFVLVSMVFSTALAEFYSKWIANFVNF